jgi:hypothetical protein
MAGATPRPEVAAAHAAVWLGKTWMRVLGDVPGGEQFSHRRVRVGAARVDEPAGGGQPFAADGRAQAGAGHHHEVAPHHGHALDATGGVERRPEGDVGEPRLQQHRHLGRRRDAERRLDTADARRELFEQARRHQLGDLAGGHYAQPLRRALRGAHRGLGSAPSPTICDAMPIRRWPPGVSAIPLGARLIRSSSKWRRSAANACDTAGSLTPSTWAAARTTRAGPRARTRRAASASRRRTYRRPK